MYMYVCMYVYTGWTLFIVKECHDRKYASYFKVMLHNVDKGGGYIDSLENKFIKTVCV